MDIGMIPAVRALEPAWPEEVRSLDMCSSSQDKDRTIGGLAPKTTAMALSLLAACASTRRSPEDQVAVGGEGGAHPAAGEGAPILTFMYDLPCAVRRDGSRPIRHLRSAPERQALPGDVPIRLFRESEIPMVVTARSKSKLW
jgi:hypothetical protein